MIVEVWSDVVCPWCYIGKRRFEAALARFTDEHPEVEVEVRYRAFMLDPAAPVGQSEPVRQAYERKFGGPDAAAAVIERVTEEAAGEGLDFRMAEARRSNTLAAHRLLVLAEERGRQPELKERLLAAYFTEGKAIGEIEVLVAEAVAVGLDGDECRAWLTGGHGRAEVADQLEFAADNGLTSVPTFVFDRRFAVPGAQPSEVFVSALEQQLT
ncbi:MAG: DsbA family oxidoreductase [Actinomycetota bacterium]